MHSPETRQRVLDLHDQGHAVERIAADLTPGGPSIRTIYHWLGHRREEVIPSRRHRTPDEIAAALRLLLEEGLTNSQAAHRCHTTSVHDPNLAQELRRRSTRRGGDHGPEPRKVDTGISSRCDGQCS